jgi:outer membrane protein OmpA-like peptidoglycan-associated protein
MLKPRAILIFIAAIFLFSTASFALNVQTFRPKVQKDGILTLPGSSSLGHNKWGFGLFYNYAHDLLEEGNIGLKTNAGIAKHLHTIDALLAYGIMDWWTIHLDVPFHALSIVDRTIIGGSVVSDTASDLGEMELSMLFTLRKNRLENERRIGFAVMPFVTTNTRSLAHYHREDGVSGGAKLISDKWLSEMDYVTMNIGFRIRPEETIGALRVNDDFMYGAGYQRILSKDHEFDFFAEIYGSTTFGDFASDEKSSPIEILGGFKKGWSDTGLSLAIGAGRGILGGYGTPDIRVFSGLTYIPVAKKPAPQVVIPPIVEVKKGTLGLTTVNDKDETLAADITVTDQSGNVIQKYSGSSIDLALIPGTYKIDITADGYTPQSGEVQINPGELVNRKISMVPIARIVAEKIEVNQVIYFDFGKATIQDISKPILDEVVKLLKAHPEVKLLSIEGHTDNIGTREFNTKLSGARAKSVADYLTSGGIESNKLTTQGFGPDKPIAGNDTKDGRAKNRRVEFLIKERQ